MRKHWTTIIGVLAMIVIVAAVFAIIPHHSNRHSADGIPVSKWKYSGFDTPKSSVISAAAAIRKDNGQAFVDALTPEMRKCIEFCVQPAMQKNHKTLAQLVSAYAPRPTANATLHIVKQQELNDRWALMVVKVCDGNKQRTLAVVLRKIDGEWKVDHWE